jgi:hypothetical protein
MSKDKNETLTAKDIYDEIGTNYRYFLNWRHALFAGYLVILFTLANAYSWLTENDSANVWIIYLVGLLITFCFWGLEYRVRDLYQACTKAGCEMERAVNMTGVYTELDSKDLRKKVITHSGILNWFYGIIAFSMLLMFVFSFCKIIK